MNDLTATYSPEDNKLRLTASSRLDKATYDRVRSAGFIWAPKQGLFVAPMWTPSREDLMLEMCGEIGDEDRTLVERAGERADRFETYSEKRATDAEQARKSVSAITDGIPLGQPILVGHHSERHARKDAERIESGMRRAVAMWETSLYWQDRARGAIRAAKYKELPNVRARRIKGLEADKRKQEKTLAQAEQLLKAWLECGQMTDAEKQNARASEIANYDHGYFRFPLAQYPRSAPASQYEGDMGLWSALDGGIINGAQAVELAIPGKHKVIDWCKRWIAHLDNRLAYERAMLEASGGIATDKTGPQKGGACRCWASPSGGWSYIQKVNKVSVTVLDNWGNGGGNFTRTIPFDKLKAVMTAAEVQAKRDTGALIESAGKIGFFLRDAPLETPRVPKATPLAAKEFDAMKDSLKAGVKVVAAHQLFPTPPSLARRMVQVAEIETGHTVLEPSAGTGAILTAIRALTIGAISTAVEINCALADRLRLSFDDVRQADFLECNGDLGSFDRILMNPPFERGADIEHITHALTMLKGGGRLVAICANGPRQREKLMPLADEWIELEPGIFKDSGTMVSAVMMVVVA